MPMFCQIMDKSESGGCGDYFSPLVNDPYVFGQLAASNAAHVL